MEIAAKGIARMLIEKVLVLIIPNNTDSKAYNIFISMCLRAAAILILVDILYIFPFSERVATKFVHALAWCAIGILLLRMASLFRSK